ncbi:Anaphase-promoting complex subunit 1 [Aphelenchoides fujianensis]|nr:Anaphase-promoting complex subunit 1 [Aphelenchoides fujianensis]
MSEIDPTMLVPPFVKPVKRLESTVNVGYRLVDGEVLERVFFDGNTARVFRALTDVQLRTHFTNKPILNAFYHDFGVHSHSDPYLCIASCEELKLISLERNECQTINLPIKIQSIFSTKLGLLLVRAENDDSDVVRGPGMLFSLSHPYGELLAVLCKFKGNDRKPFVYIRRRIEFIPSPTESNFLMAHDVEENVNHVFLVRDATDEEKRLARAQYNETVAHSMFAESNASGTMEFGRPSYGYSQNANLTATPTGGQISWKERFGTPRTANSSRFSHLQLSKSQSESATSRVFADLSQQAHLTQNFDHTHILSEITGEPEAEVDPHAVEWTLEGVWTDEFARSTMATGRIASKLPVYHASHSQGSLSALKRSNQSRNKLDKEISEQFTKNLCLTRKPSSFFVTTDLNERTCLVYAVPGANSVGVIKFERPNFRVAAQPTSVQAAHAIPLLGTNYWICSRCSPVALALYSGCKKIADLAVSCVLKEAPELLMSQLLQLVCRSGMQFEMLVDFRTSFDASPTKEPAHKKARSVLNSPRKRAKGGRPMSQPVLNSTPTTFDTVLSIIRNPESQPAQSSSQESPHPKALYNEPPSPDEIVLPPSRSSVFRPLANDLRLVEVRMDGGTTTAAGRLVFDAILRSLPECARMDFAIEWLCSNSHRVVQADFSKMIEVELSLLFKLFFETLGVDPRNFPFVREISNDSKADDSPVILIDEKRPKRELSADEEESSFLHQFLAENKPFHSTAHHPIKVACAQTNRLPIITPGDSLAVFKALHDLFDAFRRLKDGDSARAREFMIQPLFIFASMYQLTDFAHFYGVLDPKLSTLNVMPMENLPRLAPSIQRPPLDSYGLLYDSFENELEAHKDVVEPVLTRTQYNKLKILVTQDEIAKWVRLRWPTDIRLCNIATMLDSTRPVLIPDLRAQISETRGAPPADAQLRELQEKFLVNVALRTITRSFGAALLHFHSLRAEPMEIALVEKICLSGKISPSNMNLEYPVPDQAPAKGVHKQMMEWANFYSGVARGLATILGGADRRDFGFFEHTERVHDPKRMDQVFGNHSQFPLANSENEQWGHDHWNYSFRENEGPHVVDWEWVFTKIKENKDCSPALAGYILAAGLSGQNMSVNPFDLHEFLSLSDKLVVIALLLGTSVAYRGTFNFYVNKMIFAHLPFLLQPTSCDFRINPVVQTVAILSLGWLYAESMQTQLTNDLLNQMSKETFFESDPDSERYAYVLSTGFAVGLINLCKGDKWDKLQHPFAVEHLSFHERLFLLLNGGRRDLCIVNYQKDPCTLAQKGCCSCGMSRGDQKFQSSQHQHHHRQRADVVTPAGAATGGTTAAAGSSTAVASNVASASSHVLELSNVNIHLSSPAACAALALVYMRTNSEKIAKRLAVPDKTRAIGLIRPDVVMLRTLAAALVMFDSIAPYADWLADQIPEVLREHARNPGAKTGLETNTDEGMLSRAYVYAKTGACFALALKFTSTCDDRVTELLMDVFNEWMSYIGDHETYLYSQPTAGLTAYINCVNVIVASLAIVNAGSGDIRRVRFLNSNFGGPVKEGGLHSAHVIGNMALGLIYLGQGRYGLGRSNMSLAALLISFFPVFGHSITDNRCYFQGFRFLWTIAVEPRFLVTVAEGSQEPVVAPLEIGFKDENTRPLNTRTPLLLPPLDLISVIRIRASDFQPLDLDLNKREDVRVLREVLTRLSGRLPLRKRPRACGSWEFRTLKSCLPADSDAELRGGSSEHSFDDE